LGFWNRWVDMSSVVTRNQSCELELKEDCQVVYGGDVWDRGSGDLRVIRDIVSLKKRYPSRVHIVLGNRDINKIRLVSELTDEAVKKDLRTYWTGRLTAEKKETSPVPDRLRLVRLCPYSSTHIHVYRLTPSPDLYFTLTLLRARDTCALLIIY
jgi:hypothetical protein